MLYAVEVALVIGVEVVKTKFQLFSASEGKNRQPIHLVNGLKARRHNVGGKRAHLLSVNADCAQYQGESEEKRLHLAKVMIFFYNFALENGNVG